jgi:hypothetical protein
MTTIANPIARHADGLIECSRKAGKNSGGCMGNPDHAEKAGHSVIQASESREIWGRLTHGQEIDH